MWDLDGALDVGYSIDAIGSARPRQIDSPVFMLHSAN